MVAVDPLEQMHAETFKLVGTDARRYRVARRVKIGGDFCFAQLSHGQASDRDMVEQDVSVPCDSDGRVEFMGEARQGPQLVRRLGAPAWFAEQAIAERQCLIGAYNNVIRPL